MYSWLALFATLLTIQVATAPDADPYLWLEDVTGEKALGWVRERNAESTAELAKTAGVPGTRTRGCSGSSTRRSGFPFIEKRGARYYNFWRDEQNQRGLWRRTTLEEYRKASPAWETVLDLDALGRAEHENWVWQGAVWLEPDDDRALVLLSRGGADAAVVREFDPKTKAFVTDGFALPEAKSDVAWKDRDTLLVGTDFGPGSLTDSGYPRIDQGVEARHGSRYGNASCTRARRPTSRLHRDERPDAWIRARPRDARDHVLGVRRVLAAARGPDQDRQAARRRRQAPPRVAPPHASHPVAVGRGGLSGGCAAGVRPRSLPGGRATVRRALRAL